MNMCSLPEQNEDRGPWIATLSGIRFYIREMNLCDIPLDDMAHALSMNCRYNGHISRHYSVAEHSLIISEILELWGASRDVQLQGLLHDISEVFVPDIPRPFKGEITGFKEYEDALLHEASLEFDFMYPFDERVLWLDRNIVRNEAEALFPNPPEWTKDYEWVRPMPRYIGLDAIDAKNEWLQRYEDIRSDSMGN